MWLKEKNFKGHSTMCLEEQEMVDHLHIHCRQVSSLWHLSLSLMGSTWVQPFTVKDFVEARRRRMKRN